MASASSPLSRLPALASLLDPQGSQQATPDQIKRRRLLAQQLGQDASSPNGGGGSLLGAIGQGLKGFAAARMEANADADERAGHADLAGMLARLPRAGGGGSASGAPAGFSATPTGPLSTNAQDVYTGLTKRGIPSMIAAGLTGNIDAESGFRLGVADNRGEGSVGLIQARGPRLVALKELGARTGRDPFSLDNQLDHIAGELQGSERKAFDIASQAKTPGEAAVALARHYERPAAWALEQSAPRRAGVAERAYRQFGSAADMPMDGAMPVAEMGSGQPGFQIPGQPDAAPLPVGAPIPAEMQQAQPQQAPPDMQALFDRQPMAPTQSFAQDTALPEIETASARNVPLPPQRPSVAALLAAPAQAPSGPSPQAAAMPFDGVTQPPSRAPGSAAGPAPQAAAPMQAGAPPPAQRSGLAAILGGVQDGLDGVFGGEQTQERLRRQAMASALNGGQPTGASPQSRQLAQALMQPTENGSAMPASAVPQPTSYTGGPRRSPVVGALTGRPDAGSTAAPPAPMGQDQRGAPAQMAPAGAQAGDERDLYQRIAVHPYASDAVQRFALDKLNPKLSHIDMGDSIGFVDTGGNLVRSYPKTRGPMTAGPNTAIIDPNTGREIYRNPKEPELTPDQRNYAQAQQGGYGGSFNDFLQQRTQRQGQAVTVKDASGNERTLFYDPQSNQLRTPEQMGAPPAPAPTNPYTPGGRGMTEEQSKNAGYAGRMTTSHSTINELENVGTGAIEAGIARIPGGNVLLSTGKQRLVQAQSDFVNSLLRRESGAAINKDEFDRYAKQYFPQPGDGAEVIAAKRRSREDALEGVFTSAGPNYRVPEGYSRSAPREAAGPKIGAVEDGHVYIGGDPASPSSWTRTR